MTIRTPDWVKSILSAGVPDIVVDKITATDILAGSVVSDTVDVTTLNSLEIISEVGDLPDPSGGTHSLEAMTPYLFDGFITSDAGLELGSLTPIIGYHGGSSGFIHTGGNTALVGEDVPYFSHDVSVSAPGGTLFDLSSANKDEMLVESVSYADFLGMGDFASLGTIEGYRVPSFKGCNFENFAEGLTFTGSPDKVFFSECPLRSVTDSGVRIISLDANFETDIFDVVDCYVKGVQSDTEVIYVDPSATISEAFQYRGTTHDPSVTASNILTGTADVDEPGYRITDSPPLTNSKSFISYSLDSDVTANITTQASSATDGSAYVRIPGSTTVRASARFDHTDNSAEFVGDRSRFSLLAATTSLGTGTSDVVSVAWFVNGSIIESSAVRIQMNQQGGGVSKSLTALGVDGNLESGDTFDVRVANLGSTSDIDVGELNAQIST